jgi:hypothetical protein
MTPTSTLRFVERVVPAPEYVEGIDKTARILQQWYEDRGMRFAVLSHDKYGVPIPRYQGEWRDIPLETEE